MPSIRFNLNRFVLSLRLYMSSVLICVSLLASGFAQAGVVERDQARRIHDRLAGVPPTNAVLTEMEALILDGGTVATEVGLEAAAQLAMDNAAFYNVTLKNYVAPWTNEAQSVFVPLNDYTATVIGIIRDDVDFRQVLSGDIIYTGSGVSPAYSNANNDHYAALELLGPVEGNLANSAILIQQAQSTVTQMPSNATAGVITTRAAASAFFVDGTNRSMFRFTLINHLCTDLESLKDVSRVPDRVRQDVSRSPGGDSRIFMFSCVGCHAGMDGLTGAYAQYNFNNETQQLDYTPNQVAAKYSNNANNFKSGYITTGESWINYWRNGQNKLLGWSDESNLADGVTLDERQHAVGTGAKSMGAELANSKAFASCQVKKAFKAVCLHDSDDYIVDRNKVDEITLNFMSGYNMKTVFAKVAAYCSLPASE